MHLESTCIDMSAEKIQNILERSKPINYKWLISIIRKHLYLDLCHRFKYKNLQNLGWKITDTSIKVPTFTDEEAIRLTEQLYEIKISNYQIIELDVEVPPPTELY